MKSLIYSIAFAAIWFWLLYQAGRAQQQAHDLQALDFTEFQLLNGNQSQP